MTSPTRLKRILHEVDERAGDRWLDLPLLSVSISWGVRRRDQVTSDDSRAVDLSNYKVCRAGDLVINRMRAFQGALGIAPEDGIASPDYAVLQVADSVNRAWLSYLMTSATFVSTMASLVRGIGGTEAGNVRTPRINVRDLGDLAVTIPTPPDQRAIADYLDRETAQIDALIAKQERLIASLRERRETVIRSSVPEGNSERFMTDKLGRRARIGNGSTPLRENVAYWVDGRYPWLNSAVVNRSRVTGSDQFVTEQALAECHLPRVAPGSVLVGLTGQGKTRGMATLLETEATVSQHIAYITPDPTQWRPDYLLWCLTASYGDLRRLSDENGSTKGGLTCEDLKRFRVAVPLLDEQRRIVAHLDEQTVKLDALIAKTERFIELSKERRTALITAAVTGQIDVRNSA